MPSIAEWNTLINFLGGASIAAGVKMKTTTGWTSYPGITNTNSSGFSGLPGGVCNWDQTFYGIKDAAYWWSSTEDNTFSSQTHAYHFNLFANMITDNYGKINGMSVRCLKD